MKKHNRKRLDKPYKGPNEVVEIIERNIIIQIKNKSRTTHRNITIKIIYTH